jgi:pyruvate/2-oxoacid:ferredoxin oxidoreductase alpha subunit
MSAIGYVIGASAGGVRVFTATSSQGIAWMHEGLHYAAGSRLPIVMVVVNRPIAAPWNLTTDQTDSLSQRDTGWMQFYCESNQEVLDTVIQAYKLSESLSVPSMVCLDGVYLSYIAESVDIPEQEKVDEYLPAYRPEFRDRGLTYKVYTNCVPGEAGYDINRMEDFMRAKYVQHRDETKCFDEVLKVNQEFQTLFGRGYPPVEAYRCEDAEVVVVMSGSAVGTCRYVIDNMRKQGYKVGLVKLKLFRPFPYEFIRDILGERKRIVVIERDISMGQCGIFYQEIKWALNANVEHKFIPIYGFIAGLGGIDITPNLIEKAILYTITEPPPRHEILWLGLDNEEIRDE